MRTEKAIRDLAEIRQRLNLIDARVSFRCFSLVVSAIVFSVASFGQPLLHASVESSLAFVSYWFVVAVACIAGIGGELWWRAVSLRSRITVEWSRQMVAAMLPVISVSALTTWALLGQSQLTVLLPGIWAIFAGLAIASASRLLPAICQAASFWWIVSGAMVIRFSEFFAQHSNLTMSLLFGAGQLLLAICFFAGVQGGGRDE